MQPLAGVRVIEAGQMISAPIAGVILAEQGAVVIKVELADGVGDRLRELGSQRNHVSALFNAVNRGKQSVTLDTKHPDGLQALLELCATADVFLQNFRPGTAERMGVGEAQLRAINPDIVYVSVSGFGSTGPKAEQRVDDYVIQVVTGMAALQEGDTGAPQLDHRGPGDHGRTVCQRKRPRRPARRAVDARRRAVVLLARRDDGPFAGGRRVVDNDVPGARIVTRHEVADDPQVVHNGSLVHLDDEPIGACVEARPPFKFGDGERRVPAAAPALGSDTMAVLRSLGYDDDRLAALTADGVLGPTP